MSLFVIEQRQHGPKAGKWTGMVDTFPRRRVWGDTPEAVWEQLLPLLWTEVRRLIIQEYADR